MNYPPPPQHTPSPQLSHHSNAQQYPPPPQQSPSSQAHHQRAASHQYPPPPTSPPAPQPLQQASLAVRPASSSDHHPKQQDPPAFDPPPSFPGSNAPYPPEKAGQQQQQQQQEPLDTSDPSNLSAGAPPAGHFVGAGAVVDDVGTFNGGSYRISHRDSNTILTIQLAIGCPMQAKPGMYCSSPCVAHVPD